MADLFLTPKELSYRWKISEGTLANWRYAKRGPKYIKIGSSILYSMEEVLLTEKQNWGI